MHENVRNKRMRILGSLLLAWGPFAIFWSMMTIVSFDVEPLGAFTQGVGTIGSAAVLSLVVWWLTGQRPWPPTIRPSFYAMHVIAGVTFSLAWLVFGIVAVSLLNFEPLPNMVEAMQAFLGWRMLTGFWLYGLIAGVSYTLRGREALRRHEQAALKAEALVSSAQLDALRSRINPHFFFNTLHALSALIHKDPDLADDAVDRIGHLMRKVLASDSHDPVPLSEEWAFTREYLELEKLRLGDRLRVIESIDSEADSCVVPQFVLQPLVENAVLHGVAPRPEGGIVKVGALCRRGRLEVQVEDDGPGPGAHEGNESKGLDLLRKRLDVLYDGDASVRLARSPRGGCVATINLPAEKK